ncbi:MAG: hypothetical protein NTZ78_05655 [Candidatus Aureabacteria bacterium]|nr:hypothetical protein [Candidatus Auribacterota bacterium]
MERGYDVDGFQELADAVAAFRHPHRAKPLVIVLELGGPECTSGESEELMRSGIPIIALASELNLRREQLKVITWPNLLHRPFSIAEVADLVDKIIKEL